MFKGHATLWMPDHTVVLEHDHTKYIQDVFRMTIRFIVKISTLNVMV